MGSYARKKIFIFVDYLSILCAKSMLCVDVLQTRNVFKLEKSHNS